MNTTDWNEGKFNELEFSLRKHMFSLSTENILSSSHVYIVDSAHKMRLSRHIKSLHQYSIPNKTVGVVLDNQIHLQSL